MATTIQVLNEKTNKMENFQLKDRYLISNRPLGYKENILKRRYFCSRILKAQINRPEVTALHFSSPVKNFQDSLTIALSFIP